MKNSLTAILLLLAFSSLFEEIKSEIEDYGPKLKDGDRFDFIIVGSGSGGSVVGNRLSENPDWNILVLELGREPPEYAKKSSFDPENLHEKEAWIQKAEPQEDICLSSINQQCQLITGKVYGGSSTISNMIYQRGIPEAYNEWANFGNIGWDWNSVLPYFKKSENSRYYWRNSKYHGNNGSLAISNYPVMDKKFKRAIINVANSFGLRQFTHDGRKYNGFGDLQLTIQGDTKSSVYEAFIRDADERSNFHLAGNAFVTKILIEDGPKAIGVEVEINGNKFKIYADKEVIVSAGTLSSPKLLMLSGIGPKDDLEKMGIEVISDLSVGKNLQDHLVLFGLFVSFLDTDASAKSSNKIFINTQIGTEKVHSGIGPFTGIVSTRNESVPNIQIANLYSSKVDKGKELNAWIDAYGFVDNITNFFEKVGLEESYLAPLPYVTYPESRGFLKLRSSNPYDPPSITMNYLDVKEDIDMFIEAINFIEMIYTHPDLSEFNPKLFTVDLPSLHKYEYKSREYWEWYIRNMATSILHYVGTCKMGPADDKNAVVDSRLRVYGVDGLRVIDASIMPTFPSGNTMAPTIMIGEKGSQMIQEDYMYES